MTRAVETASQPAARRRREHPRIEVKRGCSVGVMAYNEEASIAASIESILAQAQQPTECAIDELIVVASGCEDRTVAIVAEIAERDRRVRVIEQPQREGKASAINLFLAAARSPVLVMVSADVLLEDGTLDALLRHFDDPSVGMVGGHPTPVNEETTFLGHAVHLQWRLHDRLARETPKLGEIVAFRNVVSSIPLDTAVDEISIQALTTQLGYKLVYEPQAVVYNRGPATVADFLRQRRRIYAGHLQIREQQGYAASTMSSGRIGRALLKSGSFESPRAALWTTGTVGLEAVARALGHYDFVRRRSHQTWEVSTTTKGQLAEGASARGLQNVLVFHIADFNRRQLELGAYAARQLRHRAEHHIKRALGAKAVVSVQRSGTIMALVPGEHQAAERLAREVVEGLEDPPLVCGIIAFSQAGPPVARSIEVPGWEVTAEWG
jgi:poly-beta-1,6-N-acetyl-D-glucosamine synthase